MKAPSDTHAGAPSSLRGGPIRRAVAASALALAAMVFVLPGTAPGQGVPLDYEAHERMKADLASRVIMVEVQPAPVAFETPSMVPERFGQGAAVMIDGAAVIATSWFLVNGAASIFVSAPDGSARAATRVLAEFPDRGLAILFLPPDTGAGMKHRPLTPGAVAAPDPARLFFCVSPVTPGTFVLTETTLTDRAGPPLDAAFLAPGILVPGTVLFDAAGVPFAVAARESYAGNRFTIVAPIGATPAADAAPEGDADVREP